jgi:hypothetical protein
MEVSDLQVDRYYRTRSGRVCKVTGIDDGEEKTVSYVPYENDTAGEAEQMPAVLFTANIKEEVEQVDPQGNPMTEAPATPV